MRSIETNEINDFINKNQVTKFFFDSKRVVPGGFFFALKGAKVDACDFLQEVALKGGIAAVVPKYYAGNDFGLKLFYVDDVVETLHFMARQVILSKKMKVVGVTGSVGKTTTKEFIATLLSEKYRVQKTEGNANSQIGFPTTILNSGLEADIFVAEMGMNHKGEIANLVKIMPPDIALVTRIGISHMAFFKDIEEIAMAKAEIFLHPETKVKIVSSQALTFKGIKDHDPKIVFGLKNDEGDYHILAKDDGFVVVERGIASPIIHLPFKATHLVDNFLAAVTLARALDLSWDEIISGAKKLKTFQRRFEVIEKNGITYINDSYNFSPDSVKAAVSNLPLPQNGRTIAFLSWMGELGKESEAAHIEVGEFLQGRIDYLVGFGIESKIMLDAFAKGGGETSLFSDFDELRKHFNAIVKKGDVVLVKGANSLKFWRLFEEV